MDTQAAAEAVAVATHSSRNLQEHLKAQFHTRLIVELTDHSLAERQSVEDKWAAHWLAQNKLLQQLLGHCYMQRDLEVLGMQHIQQYLQQPARDNPVAWSDTAHMRQQELLAGHRQTVAVHQVDHNLPGCPAAGGNWQQLQQRQQQVPGYNHLCLVCHRG